eukprot:Tbor_TRINITY_DN5707_c0_g1::TRINITY_DN5707_c0_g1_i7::g.21012::m.21012
MTATEEEKMDLLWELWPPTLVENKQGNNNYTNNSNNNNIKDLSCPICFDLAFDPVVTDKCGHLFCRQCLETWMKKNKECPIDRAPLSSGNVRDDMRASRHIGNLCCKCKKVGCQWKGCIDDLPQHCKACGYKPENSEKRKRSRKPEPQSDTQSSLSEGLLGIGLIGLLTGALVGGFAVLSAVKMADNQQKRRK